MTTLSIKTEQCYAKCHILFINSERHYAERRYAEPHYAERYFAERHYAECRLC
jgi:hypothetical protein